MRRIKITESQLKRILNEKYGVYVNTEGGEKPSPISYGTETSISDKIDGEYSDVFTDDKIKRVNQFPFYRARYYGGMMENKKKKLNEINSDFKNRKLTIPKPIIDELNQALSNVNQNSTGYKRLRNLINTGTITASAAYRIMHDYKNIEGYSQNSVIPSSLINWMTRNIKGLEQSSRMTRKTKEGIGVMNANRNPLAPKGTGHHKPNETSNGCTVTYTN